MRRAKRPKSEDSTPPTRVVRWNPTLQRGGVLDAVRSLDPSGARAVKHAQIVLVSWGADAPDVGADVACVRRGSSGLRLTALHAHHHLDVAPSTLVMDDSSSDTLAEVCACAGVGGRGDSDTLVRTIDTHARIYDGRRSPWACNIAWFRRWVSSCAVAALLRRDDVRRVRELVSRRADGLVIVLAAAWHEDETGQNHAPGYWAQRIAPLNGRRQSTSTVRSRSATALYGDVGVCFRWLVFCAVALSDDQLTRYIWLPSRAHPTPAPPMAAYYVRGDISLKPFFEEPHAALISRLNTPRRECDTYTEFFRLVRSLPAASGGRVSDVPPVFGVYSPDEDGVVRHTSLDAAKAWWLRNMALKRAADALQYRAPSGHSDADVAAGRRNKLLDALGLLRIAQERSDAIKTDSTNPPPAFLSKHSLHELAEETRFSLLAQAWEFERHCLRDAAKSFVDLERTEKSTYLDLRAAATRYAVIRTLQGEVNRDYEGIQYSEDVVAVCALHVSFLAVATFTKQADVYAAALRALATSDVVCEDKVCAAFLEKMRAILEQHQHMGCLRVVGDAKAGGERAVALQQSMAESANDKVQYDGFDSVPVDEEEAAAIRQQYGRGSRLDAFERCHIVENVLRAMEATDTLQLTRKPKAAGKK